MDTFQFVESDGAIFRGQQNPDGFPTQFDEVLVKGEWKPAGMSGFYAARKGSLIEESEAREFIREAGEEWPSS